MVIPVRQSPASPQGGLSLIELMVALVLGSVIMLGAVTLFMQNKVSYLQDEELARIQEGGRYALRYITRELAMSGYYGGVLRGSDIDVDAGVADPNDPTCYDYMFRVQDKFELYDADDFPLGSALDDCLDPADLEDDTDVLVVRRVKDRATVDQGVTTPGAAISDTVVYLEVQDYNVSVELKNGLSSAASDIDLWEYWPQILYVRNFAIDAGDGIPTLCRRTISQTAEAMADSQCLVQGVERMHIELGLDTADDYTVDTLVADPNTPTPSNALTARVYLLLRSPNEVIGYTNDREFILGSKTVPAENDGFYRRVIQSTVGIRNSEALGI